jgi:hypothetical protein
MAKVRSVAMVSATNMQSKQAVDLLQWIPRVLVSGFFTPFTSTPAGTIFSERD